MPASHFALVVGWAIHLWSPIRNAEALREVARQVPDQFLLVETDAPYLAPVPHRGKTNQPAFVRHVAEKLAEVRGQRAETIEALTTQNYQRLFGPIS